MNNPQKNNYIQYVNERGKVQTRPVQFNDDGVNTTFVVQGIQENFFILGVYQNNIQVYGVGFDDIENNDMLAFLNSNIIDLDCIPNNAFLNAEQVVTMSYNNDYVKNFQKPQPTPQEETPLSSLQKTNERLYFEEYLKRTYPEKTDIEILPYYRVLGGAEAMYLQERKLYYVTAYGMNTLYDTTESNDGMLNLLTNEHVICKAVVPFQPSIIRGYEANSGTSFFTLPVDGGDSK